MGISGWCCFKKRYYSQRAVWFRWFLGKIKRSSNTRALAVSDHATKQEIRVGQSAAQSKGYLKTESRFFR
ncbi:hypothetical protein A7Q00_03985 [Eikenella halliae]|uniref:Uncharacterized protein n=1 Tax=Eikenella halliae TaxID=1795832 RepID=A0A1B6VZW2_9NEIS|nr:hypothetical protein A7Q00_03985 [Eikenella halliae]